jgi:hypothetical protein
MDVSVNFDGLLVHVEVDDNSQVVHVIQTALATISRPGDLPDCGECQVSLFGRYIGLHMTLAELRELENGHLTFLVTFSF